LLFKPRIYGIILHGPRSSKSPRTRADEIIANDIALTGERTDLGYRLPKAAHLSFTFTLYSLIFFPFNAFRVHRASSQSLMLWILIHSVSHRQLGHMGNCMGRLAGQCSTRELITGWTVYLFVCEGV
jgi:hypothetical protein